MAVPGWFPHEEGVSSASQAAGYNNRIAHLVAVLWIVAMLAMSWVTARKLPGTLLNERFERGLRPLDAVLPLLTALAVCLLYFPPAYAWRGPHFEEIIHLNAMHRMLAGDTPFLDFEFLYGPLMLYLPWLWTKATGLTLTGYYGYILILELITLLLLVTVVQRHIPNFWLRVAACLLLLPLFFNVMLGPNQNGLRKLLGVMILMSVARRPYRRDLWLLHGAGLGLLMGYSQEFGAATAIAVGAIYGALFVKTGEWQAVPALVTTALVAIVMWLLSIWIVLGEDLPGYFRSLAYLTEQFDAGEAAFPFHWTLNGLAVFALLSLSVWLAGSMLAQRWDTRPAQSDLLILGGVAYAAIALKSGLSRLDQWHMDPAVLVLCCAFVLPLPSRFLRLDRTTRVAAVALVALITVTYSYGQSRIARYTFRESLVAGFSGWIGGDRAPCDLAAEPVLPALVCDNGDPNDDLVALASGLASPPWKGRPVFLYYDSAALAAMVGVKRTGYLTDTFIYGDRRAIAARDGLDSVPEALVIMDTRTWDWLNEGPDAAVPEPIFHLSGPRSVRRRLEVLSSAHYHGMLDDSAAQVRRWREYIGNWIVSAYEPAFRADGKIVLRRKEPVPEAEE